MSHPWLRLKARGRTIRPETGNAGDRQWRWLRNCLARNAETAFGRQHGFATIRSIDDFRRAVPLSVYESYVPWIGRIAEGEADVLFSGCAVAFEETGGSTGGCKRIPYSTESLADFQRAILPWLADLIATCDLQHGGAYWAISPALRKPETTPGGVPIGLPDGAYLGEQAMHLVAELSTVPPWVGRLNCFEAWQLATLHALVRRSDLAMVSVWSPTFLLLLLDGLEQRGNELLQALRDGAVRSGHALHADAAAHTRLQHYLAAHDTRTLWPDLKLVSAWADGASRPYFNELEQRLPQARFQPKGLLATEGIVTVPDRQGGNRLAADSGFFEFLDDADVPRLAPELAAGKSYEVVMTTAGGLYRYRTGDRVRCRDIASGLPDLEFLSRRGLASDLVGEKLDEEFVSGCLPDIYGFRMLVPMAGNARGYALVIDNKQSLDLARLARETEQRLSRNPQYDHARRLGQLRAVEVVPVQRPLAAYQRRMVERGMLVGNVKVSALRPEPDWLTTFAAG
jgi:hypothetical protein